jgi:hypothetical protein
MKVDTMVSTTISKGKEEMLVEDDVRLEEGAWRDCSVVCSRAE